MDRTRLPVTLLAGFLGAGKTTLAARLLGGAAGRRVAVIENELAEADVDGRLLATVGAGVLPLAGGCLCCGTRAELLAALRGLAVAPGGPEAVLVEASGVADPAPAAQDVIALGAAEGRLWLRRVVTVVDALAGADERARPEWRAQVAAADLVVVAKLDLTGGAVPAALARDLAEFAPLAEVRPARQVVLADLVGAPGDRLESAFAGEAAPPGLGHAIAAHVLPAPGGLRRVRLDAFLARLAADPAVLRVKGVLDGDGEALLVQGVRAAIDVAPSPVGPAPGGATLVVIGEGLDAHRLAAELAACLRPGPVG